MEKSQHNPENKENIKKINKSKKKRDPGTAGYRLMTPALKPAFNLWYNPTIIGKENIPEEGALVIACNHIHVLDQCLTIISTKRPINYMAKKEYFEGGLRHFFRFAGCIPVNRNGRDTDAVMSALTVLRRDGAIGIFPEGTRNKTDAFILPFRYGAVSLAKKTDAMILPVGVTGDYKFRSKNLTVRFGEPFKVGDMTLAEANARLQSEVEALMHRNIDDASHEQKKKIS